MTIALNGDLSKTNRTIASIRHSFSERIQITVTNGTKEAEKTSHNSTEKQFLDELESMLSTELDSTKTKKALNFATEIYRHTSRGNDVSLI